MNDFKRFFNDTVLYRSLKRKFHNSLNYISNEEFFDINLLFYVRRASFPSLWILYILMFL